MCYRTYLIASREAQYKEGLNFCLNNIFNFECKFIPVTKSESKEVVSTFEK